MSCSSLRRAALALAALAALAACGELPRPFQPDDKEVENPLLVMADRAGVVVLATGGMPEPVDLEFAEALAGALRARDVFAHTGAGNRASPILAGWLVPGAGGRTRLTLAITAPDGETMAGYEADIDPRDFAPGGDARRRAAVAAAAAEALAAYLQPDAALALPDAPPVFIAAVAGAPPEAGRVLARALDHSLRRAKVTLAEAPGGRALSLAGRIAFQDLTDDFVALEIEWRLTAAGGDVVGSLVQQNEIPAEVLTRAWPEIAGAIADGAAEGIAELVNRARAPARQAAAGPPR